MYRFIAGNLLAPALDFARGTRTMKCLEELNRSQWWPPQEIIELQNQRLRNLISYAYENVPYYRRIFDQRNLMPADIRTIADLPKLPLLKKQEARNHLAELTSPNFPASQRTTLFTGGSTGEPLIFYRSKNDQQNWGFAAAERAYQWMGYKIGDKKATISVVRPFTSTASRLYARSRDFFKRTLVLDAKRLSLYSIPDYVKRLHKFQPRLLTGYPSAWEMVARFIEEKPEYKIRPQAISCGAEQLFDYQRELFSRVFGCDTFRYYSSWEVHSIAAECSAHSGSHISAENVIVEIVDDDGCPVKNGNSGKILITSLHNFAMPFIRYEIGDTGALCTEACPCGRGLPLLARLEGRISDTIVTSSGKQIPGSALIHVFRELMGIAQFQLVQESIESLKINIVPDGQYPQEQLNEISRKVTGKYRSILGDDIDISVHFVNSITTTADGKRRYILSNLKEKCP